MTTTDELPNVVHEDGSPVKLSELVEALVEGLEERLPTKADRKELEATLLVHLAGKTDLAALHAEIQAIKYEQTKLRHHVVAEYASSEQLRDVIRAEMPKIVFDEVHKVLNARYDM